MSETEKRGPSVNDVMFIVGLILLATGISFHWGWEIACETIGFIILTLSITAKLRGNE